MYSLEMARPAPFRYHFCIYVALAAKAIIRPCIHHVTLHVGKTLV
jgi:hypothetical protein